MKIMFITSWNQWLFICIRYVNRVNELPLCDEKNEILIIFILIDWERICRYSDMIIYRGWWLNTTDVFVITNVRNLIILVINLTIMTVIDNWIHIRHAFLLDKSYIISSYIINYHCSSNYKYNWWYKFYKNNNSSFTLCEYVSLENVLQVVTAVFETLISEQDY